MSLLKNKQQKRTVFSSDPGPGPGCIMDGILQNCVALMALIEACSCSHDWYSPCGLALWAAMDRYFYRYVEEGILQGTGGPPEFQELVTLAKRNFEDAYPGKRWPYSNGAFDFIRWAWESFPQMRFEAKH